MSLIPSSHPASPSSHGLSRREALQRILLASLLATRLDLTAFAAEGGASIGDDPDLLKKVIPWSRVLTAEEKLTVTALADLILPADKDGPAASEYGVTDFIDEWVSAPYERQQGDLEIFRAGLRWVNEQARRGNSGKAFAELSTEAKSAVIDGIFSVTPPLEAQAAFFKSFRDLVAGAYYSDPRGWKSLGYVGNVPTMEFTGAPEALLKKLGFA